MCQSMATGEYEECKDPAEQTEITLPGGTSQPPVKMTMTVQGVQYAELQQNPTLLSSFTDTIKQTLADAAGPQITKENVEVKLSSGSVVVDATIQPPPKIFVSGLETTLANAGIESSVATSVKAVPGISAVTKGAISVSGVKLSEADAPTKSTT